MRRLHRSSSSRWFRVFSRGLAVVMLGVSAVGAADELQEPPLIFALETDGKRVSIELDQPFSTQQLGGAKSATLRVEPYREFTAAGVRFRYPRGYSFEAKQDSPLLAMWTLSGNDCTIMVQQYKSVGNVDEVRRSVVDELLTTFKATKEQVTPTQLETAGGVIRGQRIDVKVAQAIIQQDVFAFRSGATVVMLIIQDSPGEDHRSTAERVALDKLFKGSLRLPK